MIHQLLSSSVFCEFILLSALKVGDDCPWEAASAVDDINMILTSFDSCIFEWIPRDRNREAHDLAFLGQNSLAVVLCISEPSCTSFSSSR